MSDNMQLLQRCREGEISAVERLLQNYQQPMFRLAYTLLLNSEEALKAVQNALLSAIYTPGRKRADESFDVWLGGLVVAACQERLSLQARAWTLIREGSPKSPAEPDVKATAPSQDAPIVAPGSRPSDAALWEAFHQLNEEQRIALTLRYFHGHNLDETARMLHTGKSTARTRLGEARDRLMRLLYPPGENAPAEERAVKSLINHDQAHLLLQSALDESLSTQEWVPLQSHLDECSACRAYRKRLQNLERDLQRVLHFHLEAPPKPPYIDPDKLLERQRIGMRRRNMIINTGKLLAAVATIGLGIALAFGMFIAPGANGNALLTPNALTETPAPTPTAALAVPFRTPVLFASNRDGNSEIYLIDPNGAATNLTQDPSQDLFPSWSPDGEWIAFISDRSGKREIYVMRISGTQLVRLTDEPDVHWEGPISWSPDGKTLAVQGTWSGDGSHHWIYLVSLDGTNQPVRLSLTRDASTPRFAPKGDWIAYEQAGASGINEVFARRIDANWYIPMTNANFGRLESSAPYQSPDAAFAWTPAGNALLYVADGPFSQARSGASLVGRADTVSRILISSYTTSIGITGNVNELQRAPINTPILDASSSAGGLMAYLQLDVKTCNGPGWHRLNVAPRAEPVPNYAQPTATAVSLSIPGLCAALPFSEHAWTSDGRWLILNALYGSDKQSALYALDAIKTQSDLFYDKSARLVIVRLTNATGQDSLPQARPQGPLLGIEPKPVIPGERARAELPATSMEGATGQIVFSSNNNSLNEVYSMMPNGALRRNLTFAQSSNVLASTWSGNSRKIAFYSNRNTNDVGPGELYVMDGNGSNAVQITGVPQDPRSAMPLSYRGAPAWSPDGSTLAVVIATSEGAYLAFLPADASADHYRYVDLGERDYTSPVWVSADKVYLFYHSSNQIPAPQTFLVVDVNGNVSPRPMPDLPGVTGYLDLIKPAAPDDTLVLMAQTQPDGKGNTPIDLYALNYTTGTDDRIAAWVRVASFMQEVGRFVPQMSAVPGKAEVIVRSDGPANLRYKTSFSLVNLNGIAFVQLASIEDVVWSQVASPDGRWLLYVSERGVWALDMDGAVAGTRRPVKIMDYEGITGIDWQP